MGSFAFGASSPLLILVAQVVGNVPVHRLVLRHRPSIGTNNPDGPICRVTGISCAVWFMPSCPWYNQSRTGWYGSDVLDHQMHRAESSRGFSDVQGPPGLFPGMTRSSGAVRPVRFIGDPRVAAESGWEAIVASLVVLGVVTIVVGICIGAFLKLSFAIRREDRSGVAPGRRPDHSARAARTWSASAHRAGTRRRSLRCSAGREPSNRFRSPA